MHHAGRLALLPLVWAALLGWHLAADRLGCAAAAAALALTAGLLMLAGTETAFYRRRAFLGHYLHPEGLLFRLLGRRALILLRELLKSLALALVLLVAALGFENGQWLLLAADVCVLAALLAGLSRLLDGEVRDPYAGPMTRHWAARTNAVLLWLAWILFLFVTPRENYGGLRWEEVLAYSAAGPAVGCDALALLARVSAVAQAMALWSAQHLFAGLKDPVQLVMAWAVFLAAFGASFLIVWTYSRALTSVVARPWAVWRRGGGDAPEWRD